MGSETCCPSQPMEMRMKKVRIMIIDDEPNNLDLLGAMLKQEQCEVSAFPRGALALAAAPELAPDLVLLDIRMPGIDGYEVCRRFKQDPRLSDIPIIFLSALSETRDKLLAFERGGVDYIAKPLSEPEVLARVRAHLLIRRHRLQLEELVRQRTEDLQAAHQRLRALDQAKTHWINMLVHELRTPLTGIFCAASVLFKRLPADAETEELRADYDSSCGRIRKLIDDARTLAALDADAGDYGCEPVCLNDVLLAAVEQARRSVTDVAFGVPSVPEARCVAQVSAELLRRAFADLLFAAACCSPSGGCVDVALRSEPSGIAVTIRTHGKSLPPDDLATFFDVGGQNTLLKGGADFGLGPACAARIIQLFKGSVSVLNGESADGLIIRANLPVSAEHRRGRRAVAKQKAPCE